MPRCKYIDTYPRLLTVDLSRQQLPGTFDQALNHLLDHAIDLSQFDARFWNDATGALAYPPALLLKLVLFANSQGIVSSRQIERACQEHVTCIAFCGDRAPHFMTIARFVSTRGEDIARVFAAVLAVCDAQGLIGREMFASDGVKLPSKASKHRSGTRADVERQAAKREAATTTMAAQPADTGGLLGLGQSNTSPANTTKLASWRSMKVRMRSSARRRSCCSLDRFSMSDTNPFRLPSFQAAE